MGDYLKLFETHTEYEAYINEQNAILPNISYCEDNNRMHYNPLWEKNYLTFVANENGRFTFTPQNNNVISYSKDNGKTWTVGNSIDVNSGNKVIWKGEMVPSSNGIGTFSSTANFDIKGNLLSLIFGDNFIGKKSLSGKNYAFYKLFNGNTKVKDASELCLVATTLPNFCYGNLFYGCTGLVHSPKVLPANNTGHGGYGAMFYNCTSLVDSPDIKATVAGNSGLSSMFWNCTSLITSPPILPSTLNSYCFRHMFYGCKNMTTAPILPAKTLVSQCYVNLFNGCKKINYIKAMFTSTPTADHTGNWVSNVATSGTFVKNSAATWDVTGNYGIPTGWTVETTTA